MATCNDCSAIEPDKRGAAGHPHLVSLGEVRSMEAARKGARRAVRLRALRYGVGVHPRQA